MSEVICSIGLLILYVLYMRATIYSRDIKIKNNEQRIAELSKQIKELKEDIYINKLRVTELTIQLEELKEDIYINK